MSATTWFPLSADRTVCTNPPVLTTTETTAPATATTPMTLTNPRPNGPSSVSEGVLLAASTLPDRVEEDRYLVRSSDGKTEYAVDLSLEACSCTDYRVRGEVCKHVYCAAIHQPTPTPALMWRQLRVQKLNRRL
jgi:hypothetical protein